jgi:hypothetical protein
MNTNLILIEGLMGSGKSTTAQRLWLHLRRQGHDARWFFEYDTEHPLWRGEDTTRIAEAGAIEPSYLEETLMTRWRDFADSKAGAEVTILEGTLTMVSFLLAMEVPIDKIRDHVLSVQRLIARLNPVLIYLRHGDAAAALRVVCDERSTEEFSFEANLLQWLAKLPYGRSHDISRFAGLAGFNKDVRDALESLFAQLAVRKLVIDVTKGTWASRERSLTDFLGLPAMRDGADRIDRPERFVGRFRDARSEDYLAVAAGERGLYLDGPRPTRLISKEDAAFHIEASCAELSFMDERHGQFQQLNAVGNLAGMSPVWVRVQS